MNRIEQMIHKLSGAMICH